jgi:hypothetical protein
MRCCTRASSSRGAASRAPAADQGSPIDCKCRTGARKAPVRKLPCEKSPLWALARSRSVGRLTRALAALAGAVATVCRWARVTDRCRYHHRRGAEHQGGENDGHPPASAGHPSPPFPSWDLAPRTYPCTVRESIPRRPRRRLPGGEDALKVATATRVASRRAGGRCGSCRSGARRRRAARRRGIDTSRPPSG